MTDMPTDAGALNTPESAQSHLVRSVPRALIDMTCGDVLASLQRNRFDCTDVVVVIDAADQVVGIASAGQIASGPVSRPLQEITYTNIEVATLEMDQERVASHAIKNPLGAVPVVDTQRRLIGLMPPQAMLAILRREHVEDLHRFAGILRETAAARDAIEGPPLRRAQQRLPWLLVGLAGSALATLVMSRFESLLQKRLAIVYFLPGIVYLADAIGTQTEAIAVRGLSLSHLKIRHLLARELWTGLLIGTILGLASSLLVWFVFKDRGLALAVGSALFAAGAIATMVGLMLPWAFQRLGFDPAYGSGPLATVIQDILSLLVYFASVLSFMP